MSDQMSDQPTMRPTLYVIDASAFIFKNFYGMGERLSTTTGEPVQAVFGYIRLLLRLLRIRQPTHLAVAFDTSGPTFRNEIYPEYKANREAPPQSLRDQYVHCVAATEALSIPGFSVSGLEADDVIGTLTQLWNDQVGGECIMVATDKDLMQLITPQVRMWDLKDQERGPDQVIEKLGVRPDQVIDALGLAGDSSDNIPGVPGIGLKTAAKLLNEHQNLEGLLDAAGSIKGKRGENLRTFKEQARLSALLATIKRDADLGVDLSDVERALRYPGPSLELTDAFFSRFGFERFKRDLRSGPLRSQLNPNPLTLNSTLASSSLSDSSSSHSVSSPKEEMIQLDPSMLVELKGSGALAIDQMAKPVAAQADGAAHADQQETQAEVDRTRYRCVLTMSELNEVIKLIGASSALSIDLETTSLSPHRAQILGVALAWGENEAAYVPLDHFYLGVPTLLPAAAVWGALAPLLTDPELPKIAQNHKYEIKVLAKHGVEVQGWAGDPMLIAHLLDPSRTSFGLDALTKDLLGHVNLTFSEVAGKRGPDDRFQLVEIERATEYAAEDADMAWRLYHLLKPQLDAEPELAHLYSEVELPLSAVLAEMESRGVMLDSELLRTHSGALSKRIIELQSAIYDLAGERFNLDSPKQLGTILFEKLGLVSKGAKKRTSTGQLSTRHDLLEQMKGSHKIIDKILEYRHLAKLKSTYLDALPKLIEDETQRLHTSFKQTGTTTGRLSSSDPNLQNIPLRTAEGRKIREAFIAPEGWSLISADYSQVELRLLAHFANAERLIEGFKSGADIHAATASEIFSIPPEKLTSDQRRSAKAINFGLMYGMGAKRLSESIGVSVKEAKHMIELYFERYGEVRAYFSQAVADAELHEVAKTLMGRRRPLPDINRSGAKKKQAERLAVNTPIQGTAADILKVAMVSLDRAIKARGLKARMLLTVHDELVLEAPDGELSEVTELIKSEMEGAAKLSVPLEVEVGVGMNWSEIH